MKQQNFLFVDLVSSIFLLLILIGNFMGLLYITDSNVLISLISSLFFVVCYYFIVQQLKKNKELMVKNKFIHYSSIFWVFFFVLSCTSFFLMSHAINVEYNCKEQIKKEAIGKIKIVDSIATDYKNRSNADVLKLEAELKTKLNFYIRTRNNTTRNELIQDPYKLNENTFNNNYIDVNQVASAKVTPYLLKIQKNIENIDTTIRLNSKKYQSVFDNWKRLSIAATYSKLNQYIEENLAIINAKIAELPFDKTSIVVPLYKNQIPLNNPNKLNKLYPPKFTLPLFIILMTHLFILIPFFTEKIRTYTTNSNKETLKTIEKGTIEI